MRNPNSTHPVTILDVAAEANLSKSTVSLLLKGSPLIRAETAARVRAAASKLGYVYNSRAGELRDGTSKTIGVVVNDLANPFFAEILVGVERKLVEAGDIVLETMGEKGGAGIVLCPAYGTPRTLTKEVEAWGIPLVVMVRTLGPGKY